ncbi:MAG: zinc-binding dehydrogenase [Pseudobutyrivibrio sp.]|uniref:alcohol dehydrogenase catalytic domain-containing protein n=1 Tax=Pseudobutyrivibrio sp. TaxID=2014367 RepID=UPI0025D37074|nr:zinc-binding dehydrogenase [Pseudobutyrivibrio sp.]MBQ8490078.1 zinc-binding dehydrogenase [Pseudobutyrivibrio sp.]
MKAVVINDVTSSDNMELVDVEVPKVIPGWVLVKIKAFGLNHSEQILRLNEIKYDYIKKPIIPGIECVGEIVDASDTDFKSGQKVIAMMGGMGRSFNGSYAEYALLPAHHVFAIESNLKWEQLAVIPETYYTAWGSLFESLNLKYEDTLLIRGASCALGRAAIQLAKAVGCKVIATTHKEKYISDLSEADQVIIDDGKLTKKICGVTKALDLVGPRNLTDTLTAVEKGALVCQTGILGGVYSLNGFDPIKDIPNRVYLTGFYSNYPTQEIVDDMFRFINVHQIAPKYGPVFKFDDIKSAIKAQDSGGVDGKIVVTM